MTIPIFSSLQGYDRRWLRGDIVAGLTVWAVLVPEALAYATIAGVSPVVGLYAAPGALLLYAAFGSSRHLVTGPMAATAALSAAAIGDLVARDGPEFVQLTVTLGLVVGFMALVAGLLRLGFVANFISEPVLKGFIFGLALTIIAGQLPKLFGIPKSEGDFFEELWDLFTRLDETSLITLVVGLASLAVVIGLKEVAPVVPGSLVAVLGGIVAVSLFDLDTRGVAIVGPIESGLPSFGLPDVAIDSYLKVAPAAVGVMLVGFAEGLGAAKTYASRTHDTVDSNRELIGLGAANLGAGLSSGMVVNGSLSKTAVNFGAGARSQLSGLIVAVLTVITLLFLTGLFEELPEATLAAVVIAALVELVAVRDLVRLYRLHTSGLGRIYGIAARPDFIAAVAALFGVLLFDTLPGLFIGIIVSFILLLYRTSRPNVAVLGRVPGVAPQYADIARDPDNTPVPGIAILRPESGLFFANADAVRDHIRLAAAEPGTRAIVLDAASMPFIDITAATMLSDVADDLARDGIRFVMARDIGQVRDLLSVDTDAATLPAYATVREAVDALAAEDADPG
ncbi:MAG TPA: SulP family inorganic anion transporter [Candidatus Limnocylindria bacterium]